MHACIVFVAVLAVVRTMDLAYTKISFTTSGKPCLNDCKNNTCFTNSTLTPHACIPGNETAPVYHTTYYLSNEFTCLSRCGKFDYYYNWCYVSSNQKKKWDCCNPETRTSWTKGHRTLRYGPCADECKMDHCLKDYTCTTYAGKRNICDPVEYTYIQAKTIYDKKCVTECVVRKDRPRYYKCYDENKENNLCALPAKLPSIRGFFNVPVSIIINCINASQLNQSCNYVRENFGNMSTLAEKLEKQDYFQTVPLDEYRNPVYKYTVLAPRNTGDPWLPLVLRANITSDTIRCCDNKEAEGKTGLLIGALIGGFEDPYNTVLLSVSANEYLRKYDNDIFQWITTDHSVRVTIVIMYEDTLKPFAFGLNYVFVKHGKVSKEVTDKVVYNNLPSEP